MRIDFLFFAACVNAGIKEIANSFATSVNLQNGRSLQDRNISSGVISSDGGLDLHAQKQKTKTGR